MQKITESYDCLTGKLLIATPAIQDKFFERSVIYICGHNEQGAMGLIINREMSDINCSDIFKQLKINSPQIVYNKPIYFGGPVEAEKGFVLHSNDYRDKFTQVVNKNIYLTSTVEILESIATGHGPRESIVAIGCAGWDAGQLEYEIKHDTWLVVPANDKIIFGQDSYSKWYDSTRDFGIDISKYYTIAGNA